MKIFTRRVSDEDLVAFAEGQLGRRARQRVVAHLRERPADADRVRAYLGQNARLRKHFNPILEEPIPARLRRLVEVSETAPHPRWTRASAHLFSILVLAGLVAGIAMGWRDLAGNRFGASVERAAAERVERDAGLGTTDISGFAEAVLAARAAEGGDARLSVAADASGPANSVSGPLTDAAPALAQHALQLASVRELRHGSYVFTEYVYRHADGGPIALYEAGPTVPSHVVGSAEGVLRPAERAGTHLVEWSLGGRHYALVADRPIAALTSLALRGRTRPPSPALAGAPAPAPAEPQAQGDTTLSPHSPRTSPIPSTPGPIGDHPGPLDM